MRWILKDMRLFDSRDPATRRDSEDSILWELEALTDRNYRYLKAHPETAKLYESDVRYEIPEQLAEAKIDPRKFGELRDYLKSIGAGDETAEAIVGYLQGIEVFRDIPTLYAKGAGDCDNIACARAAELQIANVKAIPMITSRKRDDGGTTYHALVRWPDGTSEDPSLLLGMGGPARADEKREEQRKNQERKDNFLDVAAALVSSGRGDPAALGRQIDAMCLVPRGGWKL